MNTAIVALGSDIEPDRNIVAAAELLAQRWQIVRQSRPIRTTAVGMKDPADFINQAVMLQTPMAYAEFKAALKNIEHEMGRPVSALGRYAPRTIDLDIVVWNGKIRDRDFYTRDFLKTIVLEVLPELHF